MAVRKKGRRKISCRDRNYIWYIKYGDEDTNIYLNIFSEDKLFIVSYPINQMETKKEKHFIIVKGRMFQEKIFDGTWHRFYTPSWEDNRITPKLVAEIILWCTEKGEAEETYYGSEGVFA